MRRKLMATATKAAGAMPRLALAGMCAATMAFALATAAPARGQVPFQMGGPEVPGFSNSYPWFNDVPQYQGDQSFRYFLAYHPYIAQALSRNPGLLYDAEWRSQEPALEEYLASHPYEWQALNGAYWSEGPAETQWGAYDNGQWRDAYWWHQNNPDWFYNNHTDWASLDSRWLTQDGAYDQQHQWHYGEWWYNQNASWVTNNHPNWIRQHQNWQTPAVQQRYRQQHAMVERNQRGVPPQPAAIQQQNLQRATEQRQANLQQQQTMRQENQRQQEWSQQHTAQQQQATRQDLQAAHQENQQALQRQHDQQQANVQQERSMQRDNQRQQQMNRQEHQQVQQANREQQQTARQDAQQASHQQPQRQPQAQRQAQAQHHGHPTAQDHGGRPQH
jgi:hypothetical protein